MAKAVDEIDTMRDEVLPFLAEIYQREGDLPRTAFALRYIYAPCVPCVPIELQDFDGIVTNTESDDRNEQFGLESGITNRLWDNLRSEKEVRTIHLSAHVNGHYSLSEFQNRTMAPFELSQPLVKDMNKARKTLSRHMSTDQLWRPTSNNLHQRHFPSYMTWLWNPIVRV